MAADALVIEVPDNAGARIFFIGEHGAALQAGRLETMMAGGGDCLLERILFRATMEKTYAAPGLVFIQTIEIVAGGDASFAAGTGIQIHSEGVLFALTRCAGRQQLAV